MPEASRFRTALIVGTGDGLSAALARRFTREELVVSVSARNISKLESLVAETGALPVQADATRPEDVQRLIAEVEWEQGPLDVVVYNASERVKGSFVELDPAAVAASLAVTAYGGFLVAREAAQGMIYRGRGAILFTGASASIKGYPQSAPFAMGKFALRGLAQSIARELAPKGIHVAHFVIDGGIRSSTRPDPADAPDSLLSPDAIADSYWHILNQDRSAWSWEVELRPWVERF